MTVSRPAGAGARLTGARKDGELFPVEVRVTPVHTPAAQFTLTVMRDLTPHAESSPRGAHEPRRDATASQSQPQPGSS